MERLGERTYRCTTCDAVVELQTDDVPVVVLIAQSGEHSERVVTAGSVEVHRCPYPELGARPRVGKIAE